MAMILSFDKPKKIRSTEEHNKKYSSDSGIAGTYVPNMSKEDRLKWKAKHIKGDDERIEIRKEFGGANALVVVYKNSFDPPYPDFTYFDSCRKEYDDQTEAWHKRHNEIKFSTNGKIDASFKDFTELFQAITEAKMLLNLTDPQNYPGLKER